MAKSSDLTFKQFQEISRARSAVIFPQCKNWTLSDWGVALAGEVGELCNFIKKINRGVDYVQKLQYYGAAHKELADVQAYVALMAIALEADLEGITVNKFNEVSKRHSCEIVIPDASAHKRPRVHPVGRSGRPRSARRS